MGISLSPFALFLFISNYFAIVSSKSFFNITTDQQALFVFKNSITDPNAILLNNWTVHTPTCQWTGVSCSHKHQRVTSLNVSGFELLGTLSPYLGNLTFLRSLDIWSNNFTGFLPFELSKLRRLEEIDMGANKFIGEIPSWFGALSQLQRVYLDRNGFSGRIPPSLFNITRLQILDVGYNDISGKLPSNICRNITGLKSFNVYNNQLEGEILPSICSCRELRLLQLQVNHFNGNIPIEIGSLRKLERMYIWKNQFKGDIPKQIGNLTSLTLLNLESNNITGNIPKEVGNLTNLKSLRLGPNKLTAPEYGSEGKVTTCADVYSYGIMLLEMFTRKKPTDDMFNEKMSLKDWVISAIQANSVHEILTPSLLSEEDRHFAVKEQCVISVFDLAMKCVSTSPEERMNMIEVAAALQKIKAKVVAEVNTRHQHHAISIA